MMSQTLEIAVSIRCAAWRTDLRDAAALCRKAGQAALAADGRPAVAPGAEVSVVLADDAFVRRLNKHYRAQDAATNVLAFPAGGGGAIPGPGEPTSADLTLMLGDVVLAHGTISREAASQGKPLGDHLSHLVIHGVLHLLGYDHGTAEDAEVMEDLERQALASLGIEDPYIERISTLYS